MSFEIIDIETQNGFQGIKIPGEFKIDDNKVYIKKVGNVICLIPFHNPWESMFNAADNFSADYMDTRD